MPLTPTDLDLRLHVFEQLYDADCGLQLGLDDTPFSPEIEQQRAAQVAQRRRTQLGWDTERLWHFTAAPFDGFPRQDRQAWWRDYLGFTKPSQRGALFRDNSHIPPWMLALLAVNWHATPRDLVRQLRHFGTEGLFLRALLHQWSAAELAAASAWFPAAYPTPAEDFNGESCFSVLDTCLRSVCGALPPGSTRQLFRGVPRKLLDRDRDTEGIFNRALLGLGLPTPADRVHFAKVTGSSVTYATGIVPWLAGTGVAGLELLAKWLTKGSADNCREMLREVARVAHGPGIAGFFLDALDSRAATVAAEWLQAHPQALLHAELSQTQADKALQFLRGVELPDLDPDAPGAGLVKRLRAEAAAPVLADPPRWWPTTPPSPAVVPFALADLPPLPVEGGQLAAAQVAQLLGALYEEPTGPLVASVRQHVDAEARDVFATGVLAAWVNVGAPYKTRWLLEALAEIAGARFVEQLTPLVSLWPKRSRHPLAFAGVAALGRIGSREAAYALVQLACSGRGTKLENTARDAIAGLAAARGQTPTQIHDWALTTTPLTPQGHTHL
ncbi:hypothetical protein, partial [Buchananella hordeovulneris]|uniref:hypothetical protein n=1 Tax=Buchananella hordeovulneris TaxID=52770 RepID=UPI000FB19775